MIRVRAIAALIAAVAIMAAILWLTHRTTEMTVLVPSNPRQMIVRHYPLGDRNPTVARSVPGRAAATARIIRQLDRMHRVRADPVIPGVPRDAAEDALSFVYADHASIHVSILNFFDHVRIDRSTYAGYHAWMQIEHELNPILLGK